MFNIRIQSPKIRLFISTGIVFLFFSLTLYGQATLKIKVVDGQDQPVSNVTVIGPKEQYKVTSGTTTIDFGNTKTPLPDIIDHLKFSKNGWQTVSVEYFEKDKELLVILEEAPQSLKVNKSTSENVPKTNGDKSSDNQQEDGSVKVILENGQSVPNAKIEGQNKVFVTSKDGSVTIPAGLLPYIDIKGYRIVRTKRPSTELVIVVSEDTTKEDLDQSFETVVNQVRSEQKQLEETNDIIVLEINSILKRLETEKALPSSEKRKLLAQLKRLTDEIKQGDRRHEENKGKRDLLLEKLSVLLLEKDSINKLNQIKIVKLEKEKTLQQEAATKQILIVTAIALFLSTVVIALIFLVRKVKKQKGTLEVQNTEISAQKERIQTVYRELNENITSAKVIQNAILPGRDLIKKTLPNLSIFYEPRNIVSGDFYWYYQKGDIIMLAAVDCTGHGVAGAFMSFLGHEILNQVVDVSKEIHAGEVLTQLNYKLKETLSAYGTSGVNSGMDIALCIIDYQKSSMEYAGANNPLYILRNGMSEIEECKADRQGIGGRQKTSDFQFKTHIIPFKKGDAFMIFSDGYADQMGGALDKKFMYPQLRQLFTKIGPQSPEIREQILDKQFKDWKGDTEQLDDVLVICFSV